VTESGEGKTTAQQSVPKVHRDNAPDWRVRAAFYKHFSSFDFFLLSSDISSLPPAGNANRWAVAFITSGKNASF